MEKRTYLKEVASLFLKIGATAFGGPAAYIAIMQRETVRNRRWLDEQGFLDMVGATNLIPGPNATEMAMYLGLVRAGWWGYAAAGLLFIIPAMLATLVLAWVYVAYGSLPQVGWVFETETEVSTLGDGLAFISTMRREVRVRSRTSPPVLPSATSRRAVPAL